MVLVDTCGWIEWLTDGPLADRFAPHMADQTALVVPTLLQFELYRWLCRERDEGFALDVIGVTAQGRVVPLDSPLALLAGDLSARHRLAMADACIYATARQAGVELVTSDAHFQGLPGVVLFPRKGP
jgi:predicted nucleic acid-binding protein